MERRTRAASPAAKLAAGNKNKPGINAGRAGSWQHDMEHDTKPLMSCPQSIGDRILRRRTLLIVMMMLGNRCNNSPVQQSALCANHAAPASGAYKSATASKQNHAQPPERAFVPRYTQKFGITPMILQIDVSSTHWVAKCR